jgi:hypothetical protein
MLTKVCMIFCLSIANNSIYKFVFALVYGIYADVAAKDFLAVQLDSQCRK